MAELGSVGNLAAASKPGAEAVTAEKTEDKDARRAFNYALVKVDLLTQMVSFAI